jgi:hypothetical protein
MPKPSFLIIADRGGLKAFAVEQTPNRGPALRLVNSLELVDAHGKFRDKFTDQAGSFPNGGSDGQGNSIAERQELQAEMETRIFRQLASRITTLLREHQPSAWGFAAPSEINGAIIDGLDRDLHERLRWNLKRDLINTDPSELLSRFEGAEV